METLLTVMHVVFCIFLILVILLQTGKGGGMGTAFGGSSQSVFGPRGAGSFIGKLTGIVAALFMLTSLSLAYVSSTGKSGIDDKVNAANELSSAGAEEIDLSAPDQPAEDTSTLGEKVDAAPAPEEGSGESPPVEPAEAPPEIPTPAAEETTPAAPKSETPKAEAPKAAAPKPVAPKPVAQKPKPKDAPTPPKSAPKSAPKTEDPKPTPPVNAPAPAAPKDTSPVSPSPYE